MMISGHVEDQYDYIHIYHADGIDKGLLLCMYTHIGCKTEDALGSSKGLSHCIVDEEAI